MVSENKHSRGPGRPSKKDSLDTEDLLPEHQIDSFIELFGDGSENVIVQLFRLEPAYHNNVVIRGFICNLDPGDDLEVIKQRYGGGRYIVRQRLNNRFAQQKQFRIAGPPRVNLSPSPSDSAGLENDPEPNPGSVDPEQKPSVDIHGIRVPVGDFEKIKEVLLFKRMLDEIFPQPRDLNDVILAHILKNSSPPDYNSQIDQMLDMAAKVKSLTGGGEGGNSWIDLGGKVVDSFNKLLDKRGSGIPAIPKHLEIAQNPQNVQQIDRIITGNKAENIPENKTNIQENTMTKEAIAEKACSYIVQGFVQEPIQSPEETVKVLNMVLPELSPDIKSQLNNHKAVLLMVAKNILTAQVETDPGELEKFNDYFNNVFDMFVTNNQKNDGENNG